jgi:RND family efflux transporter MFP subunit
MKKRFIVLIFGMILITVIASLTMRENRKSSSTENLPEVIKIEKKAVKVEVVKTDTIIESFQSVGELKAMEEYEVMTGQSGIVEAIYVDVGDTVKKGQSLFKLENKNLITNVNNNESSLRTQMNILEIAMKDAKESYENNKILFQSGAISQMEMDDSEQSFVQSQLNYNNSVNNYNLSMENFNEDIEDTIIKSPIDGVVASKYINENQSVNNELAFDVVNSTEMVAKINVPESIINSVRLNQNALIYLDGDKNNGIEGSIVSINEVPIKNMFLYPVEIKIENEGLKLRSGMYIEASVIVDEKNDCVVIPKKSLLGTKNNKYVFIEDNGVAKMKNVEIGFNESNYIEILSGISKGDKLIVRGHEYIEEGDILNIIE